MAEQESKSMDVEENEMVITAKDMNQILARMDKLEFLVGVLWQMRNPNGLFMNVPPNLMNVFPNNGYGMVWIL